MYLNYQHDTCVIGIQCTCSTYDSHYVDPIQVSSLQHGALEVPVRQQTIRWHVTATNFPNSLLLPDLTPTSRPLLVIICSSEANTKLIRRWDSERELSLRRRRVKYNGLVRKFRQDRHGYVLKRMFTQFTEVTRCNGHYAVQGHSRSPILVLIESSSTTSYWWLIVTYLLSCTVSEI